MVEGWTLRADGNLEVHPTLRWEWASIPMTGLLRLIYAESEENLQRGGSSLQLAMTASQVRQLSEDLRKMADHLDAEPLGTQQ